MPISRKPDASSDQRRTRCLSPETQTVVRGRGGQDARPLKMRETETARPTASTRRAVGGRRAGGRSCWRGGAGNSGVPGGGDHGKHGTFCRLDGADKRRSGRTVGVPWEAGVSPAADGAGCFLGRQGPDPLKRRAGCPPPVSGGGESWPDPSHAGGHVCGGPPACRTPSCRWPAPVRPSPARGN